MPGNKLYQIQYLETVVKEDIAALSTSAKKLIKQAIGEQLIVDPIGFENRYVIALRPPTIASERLSDCISY